MFHDIPEAVTRRMAELEEIDTRDRVDGTPHLQRLRQIPPDTGRFLALLAASSPDGDWIEIGTSAGYSTMWLSLAGRARGCAITTYEILEEKAHLAAQTIAAAEIGDVAHLDDRDCQCGQVGLLLRVEDAPNAGRRTAEDGRVHRFAHQAGCRRLVNPWAHSLGRASDWRQERDSRQGQ